LDFYKKFQIVYVEDDGLEVWGGGRSAGEGGSLESAAGGGGGDRESCGQGGEGRGGEGGGRGKGGGGGQGGASSCVFLQGAEVEAAKLVAAKESIGDGF
jgi:hypothetical protein